MFFVVASREFHLARRDLGIPVGSWVAVEPNGTGLPSTLDPHRLGTLLPSPRRTLTSNSSHISTLINFSSNHQICHNPRKIPEDRVSRRHEKVLALLADNVAYYAYWATEIRRRPQLIEQILK